VLIFNIILYEFRRCNKSLSFFPFWPYKRESLHKFHFSIKFYFFIEYALFIFCFLKLFGFQIVFIIIFTIHAYGTNDALWFIFGLKTMKTLSFIIQYRPNSIRLKVIGSKIFSTKIFNLILISDFRQIILHYKFFDWQTLKNFKSIFSRNLCWRFQHFLLLN